MAARIGVAGYETADVENRYRHRDGGWRWLRWNARSDGQIWYVVAKDVTERRELELRAIHDSLTGLPNRTFWIGWGTRLSMGTVKGHLVEPVADRLVGEASVASTATSRSRFERVDQPLAGRARRLEDSAAATAPFSIVSFDPALKAASKRAMREGCVTEPP